MLKGIDYTKRISGPPLTNRRIDHYRRQGYYGPDEQEKALAEQKARSKKKQKSSSSREDDLLKALEDLIK